MAVRFYKTVKVTLRLHTEGLAQLTECELSTLAPTQNRPLLGSSSLATAVFNKYRYLTAYLDV